MGLTDRLKAFRHADETVHQLRRAVFTAESEILRLRRELEAALRENAALRAEQQGRS